ncbi:hypothetical protein KSK37_12780 [Kaistella sp. DKR-2]|uniref:hypothetical protein n=1 Tax=Kaistella soli TaxID=2849654 RepID=UPI001C25F4B5|nr:hypothetical protein [Kaistella soli]MBU8883963.1 hypothetical protein [Kaistella soli]
MDDTRKLEKEFNRIKKSTFLTLQQLGVPTVELENDFINSNIEAGNVRALRDFIWYQFNKHLQREAKDSDLQSRIYYAMAMFRFNYEEGKDVDRLKQQSIDAKKTHYKISQTGTGVVMDAKIYNSIKNCCPECTADDGKAFDLDEFLDSDRLPHKNCTCEGFGCGCSFGVVARRDENGLLIFIENDTKPTTSNKPLKTKSTSTMLQNEGAKSILSIFNVFKKKR